MKVHDAPAGKLLALRQISCKALRHAPHLLRLHHGEPQARHDVGVTNDIVRRAWEHREGAVEGFTKKHGVKRLVWFEVHDSIEAAITREKRIKNWHRSWKDRLIEERAPLASSQARLSR